MWHSMAVVSFIATVAIDGRFSENSLSGAIKKRQSRQASDSSSVPVKFSASALRRAQCVIARAVPLWVVLRKTN